MGGIDPAVLLLLVALVGIAAGGVYQQRFCADVDFRATAALQNAVAFVPAVVLAALTPHSRCTTRSGRPSRSPAWCCSTRRWVSLYVRAINLHGAAAVAMLFCVIPAVAGLLSLARCWASASTSASASDWSLGARRLLAERAGQGRSGQQRQHDPGRDGRRQDRVEAVHQPAVTR